MKRCLAIAGWCLVCLPGLGQATYVGNGKSSGLAAYGPGGAPLTYAARTDTCETGGEASGPYGCNSSATVGQQGAPLSYLGRSTDTLPGLGTLSGAGDGSAHCVTDPDFGSRICRLTDYTHFNGAGLSWNLGSDGDAHRLSADSPPSLLLAQSSYGAEAILALTYSGAGSSIAVTSSLTALYGNANLPGAAYSFSASNPTILWELLSGQYSPASALTSPPATCSTAGCVYVNQLNKLTLGCSSGTMPLCAGGGLAIKSRVKVFDLNCEGVSCPTASANQSYSGGYNVGTDSPNCLPANWATDWNGIFIVSDDDTSMTTSFSDNGQGGQPGHGNCTTGSSTGSCLGAVKLANWTLDKGCRVMDTYAGTVTGDYGATGTTINGQPNVITGVVNQPLPDNFDMHEGEQLPDANYAAFAPGAQPGCSAPPTVNLLSFTTDGSGIPTFTTSTQSFIVGQTVGFTHATESWINSAYLVVTEVINGTQFKTGTTGHNSYTSLTEPASPQAIVTSATSNSCQCGINGGAAFCNVYYWHIADLTVEPCGTGDQSSPCQGHESRGFADDYRGKYYTANTFPNPNSVPSSDANGVNCSPLRPNGSGECRLFPVAFPVDQHGTYQNHGVNDQTPVFLVSTNVCGQASGQGANACDPEYTGAWYDEVVAAENYANNGNAKHCGGAACNYRFAHTGNTGTNWNFNNQNAIGVISRDGNWAVWPTDWGLGFGCTDGSTMCLTSVQATAPANETVAGVSVDSTGAYLTITTSGTVTFVVGQRVTFSGTAESWINGTTPLIVTSVASPSFTGTGIPGGHGGFANASDSGMAVATPCSQSPAMPCQRGDLVMVALPTAHQ